MQKYQNSIQNRVGDAIYNALVTVTTIYGAPVIVFSDNGITAIPQVRTDDKGMFAFYAPNGRYNLTISGDRIVTYTLTDVIIDDSIASTIIVDTFDTLPNVLALKSVIGTTNNTTVSTLGYYAAGDGGHSTYRFDLADTTSVDNGITIIVANDGGRWKLVHNGTIMASQAGAIKDGLVATESYINNALLITGIDTIVLDEGSYLLGAQILMSGNRKKLISTGNAVLLRGFDSGPSVTISGSYCEFKDIELNGQKATYTTAANGIIVTGDHNTVSGCVVYNITNNGIAINGVVSANATKNIIRNNYVYDCLNIGIAQNTAPDNHIDRNYITNVTQEGITIDDESYHCRCTNNHIVGCGSTGAGGIGVDQTTHTLISGNYIDMQAIVNQCITLNGIAGESNNCAITGNTLITTGLGIYLKKLNPWVSGAGQFVDKYNAITGNTFKGCSLAVRIGYQCVGNVIKGNTFDNCTKLIRIDDSVTDTRVDTGLIYVFARNTIERTDVTGDGTEYVVPFDELLHGTALDFDVATGKFTAQIAGLYSFTAALRCIGGAAHDAAVISLHFSNTPAYIRSGTYSTDQAVQVADIGGIVKYMKEGDTVEVIINVSGSTKTVDIQGEGQNCYFMATLLG